MMTDEGKPEPGSLGLMREDFLALRIKYEMQRRGWSQDRLAGEMEKAGHPLHQSAISKIINPKKGKRRTISVDEALGFAKVFDASIESLLMPIELAQSQEVRQLTERLNYISEQQLALSSERDGIWERLADLNDQYDIGADHSPVYDHIGEGIMKERGGDIDDARRAMMAWLDEDRISFSIFTLKERAASREGRRYLEGQRQLLEQAMDLVKRVNDPDLDVDALRHFLQVKRERLEDLAWWNTSVWDATGRESSVYSALNKRLEIGEVPPEEVEVVTEWLLTCTRAIARHLKMVSDDHKRIHHDEGESYSSREASE